MAKKEKRERHLSAVGTGAYLALLQPNKEYNNFVAVVAFDPKQDKEFLTKLQALNKAAFEQIQRDEPKLAKKLKLRTIIKRETNDQGEPTGRVVVTFRQKATVESQRTGQTYNFHVAVFDAKGNPVPPGLKIGAGTRLKVSFEVRPTLFKQTHDAGANLTLVAAQIIDLVEWQGGTAESFGFDAVDGYSADSDGLSDSDDGETASDDEDDAEEGGTDGSDF